MDYTGIVSRWVRHLEVLERENFDDSKFLSLEKEIRSHIRPAFDDVLQQNIYDYLVSFNGKDRRYSSYAGVNVNKHVEWFARVIFALAVYLLEFPDVDDQPLMELDQLIDQHNGQEKMAFSMPFAFVASINFLYSNKDNLGAVIELAGKLSTLPLRYRYWATALAVYIHALHIRSEQFDDEARFDFQMHIANISFLVRTVESEKISPGFSNLEQTNILEACRFSLASIAIVTLPFFRPKIFPQGVFNMPMRRMSDIWIGPHGALLTKARDVIDDVLVEYWNNCLAANIYPDRLAVRWIRDLFFDSTFNRYAGSIKPENVLTRPFCRNNLYYFVEFFESSFGDLGMSSKKNKRSLDEKDLASKHLMAVVRSIRDISVVWSHKPLAFSTLNQAVPQFNHDDRFHCIGDQNSNLKLCFSARDSDRTEWIAEQISSTNEGLIYIFPKNTPLKNHRYLIITQKFLRSTDGLLAKLTQENRGEYFTGYLGVLLKVL